ncbi:protein Shroom1 [Perognathus longimembris pacificus]|uniref:protein Shroom1 n=1 Tax=Perognathus longimembris pacificus TaxID=214514 RepID=UPI002019C5D9|nr:protein Shroom1 [Perognathus longimembris pacificus]
MQALGPGGDRGASPAASTRSLDLGQLSPRADSAYSSFSAASGDPEPPRTPSPGPDLLTDLDWGSSVRAVAWGGGSAPATPDPTARPPGSRRPLPETLSRQATPLLCALAAEAQAQAQAQARAPRPAEPPSPPASRAAYRQRLQGAQRRVLRETSFQRRELRMSLPGRLRPPPAAAAAGPARLPAAHARSASLSHAPPPPAPGDPERPGGRLAKPLQRQGGCSAEPGKLGGVGEGGGGSAPDGWREAKALTDPGKSEPPEWRGEFRSSASRRSPSAAGPVSGPREEGSGAALSAAQAVLQGTEPPRPSFQTQPSRFLIQKKAGAISHNSPAHCEQRVSKNCDTSTRLPSLPDDDDDEVFVAEGCVPVRMRKSPGSRLPQGLPTSAHASDQQYGNGLSHRAGQATVPEEYTLHPCPRIAGTGDCWQRVNGSVGVSRPTSCSPPEAASGDTPTIDPPGLLTSDPSATAENGPLKPSPVDVLGPSGNDPPGSPHHTTLARGTGQPGSRPTWPSQRLQELVQELARLDPSLSDSFASQSSPEPPLGLLDGLIPLPEIWAAMRPACGETGEETAGDSEPGSYPCNLTQRLPTSQEDTRLENSAPSLIPDQPCGNRGLGPESKHHMQAKTVELASLLQKMLLDLQAEQERLQELARAWARRREDLEAAVSRSCTPRELERFTRFLADLERVLGLLLLLGSRLARVHRAMARLGPAGDPEERASLLQRLRLLQRQQEDAKELKEHVARRERALRDVLRRALPTEELCAYCALLAGKAAILARQRSLDECVRLLQDQLDSIRNDLGHRPLCSRPSWPLESCFPHEKPFPASPV